MYLRQNKKTRSFSLILKSWNQNFVIRGGGLSKRVRSDGTTVNACISSAWIRILLFIHSITAVWLPPLPSSRTSSCARWQDSYDGNPIRPILYDPFQSSQPPPNTTAPSVTHNANATVTNNELCNRYGDGYVFINHLTSCEFGLGEFVSATMTAQSSWPYIMASLRRGHGDEFSIEDQ